MSIIILYKILITLSIFIIYYRTKWLIIWALIELTTISIIILISQKRNPRTTEATTKYFLIQSLARIIILIGVILKYYFCGDLRIFKLYNKLTYKVIIIGILIKIAIFPNPFWFIDVISGIKIVYRIYIVIFSKLIPIYLYFILSHKYLSNIIIIIALIRIIFGSLLGIKQLNIRKIIGFSSINHLGWITLGFPLLPGKICSFLFIRYIMMLTPILWNLSISKVTSLIKRRKRYFNNINTYISIISILSLAGLPPLLGFFYKWIIFKIVIIKNYIIISIVMLISSLLSLFFYLQLCFSFKSIYWPELKIISLLNLNNNIILSATKIIFIIINLLNLLIIIKLIIINPLTKSWWI